MSVLYRTSISCTGRQHGLFHDHYNLINITCNINITVFVIIPLIITIIIIIIIIKNTKRRFTIQYKPFVVSMILPI